MLKILLIFILIPLHIFAAASSSNSDPALSNNYSSHGKKLLSFLVEKDFLHEEEVEDVKVRYIQSGSNNRGIFIFTGGIDDWVLKLMNSSKGRELVEQEEQLQKIFGDHDGGFTHIKNGPSLARSFGTFDISDLEIPEVQHAQLQAYVPGPTLFRALFPKHASSEISVNLPLFFHALGQQISAMHQAGKPEKYMDLWMISRCVHRDLHPNNVILNRDNNWDPVIIDLDRFGLHRLIQDFRLLLLKTFILQCMYDVRCTETIPIAIEHFIRGYFSLPEMVFKEDIWDDFQRIFDMYLGAINFLKKGNGLHYIEEWMRHDFENFDSWYRSHKDVSERAELDRRLQVFFDTYSNVMDEINPRRVIPPAPPVSPVLE